MVRLVRRKASPVHQWRIMQGAGSSATGLCFANLVPRAKDSRLHCALVAAAVCFCSAAKASAGNNNMHAAAWKVKIAAEGWQLCAACVCLNSSFNTPFMRNARRDGEIGKGSFRFHSVCRRRARRVRRLTTKMELVSDLSAHNCRRIIPPNVLPGTCHACRSKY